MRRREIREKYVEAQDEQRLWESKRDGENFREEERETEVGEEGQPSSLIYTDQLFGLFQ